MNNIVHRSGIMKRLAALCILTLLSTSVAWSQPLAAPFDLVLPSWDSVPSPWIPMPPARNLDSLGWLKSRPGGQFQWSDGSTARFVGVSIIASACFPDSLGAVVTARRLRKMGVNLVRFVYFDYHNSNGASTLAPGTRGDTLSASQMQRLDWFLYQLKTNGIHAHMVLKSRGGPRSGDGVWGYDSTYQYGQYINFFHSGYIALQKRYISAFLNHVNPYTGKRYADDPVVALYTVTDQNSLIYTWTLNRLNTIRSYMSWGHSRMFDTLFTNFLKRRYASTTAMRDAYREGSPSVGPNVITNGGFESYADRWEVTVSEGAQGSGVIVQGSDVAPGEGANSYRMVVRRVNGVESRLFLEQRVIPVRKDRIYRFRFKAKTDSAAGRQIRVILFRAAPPNENFGVDMRVNLTTSWQNFETTFRALGGDTNATYLRIYMGRDMGDVFLDGFSLQETQREGLAAEESLEAYNVRRALWGEMPQVALRRMYDQVDFYDSVSRAFYATMRGHLKSLGVKAPIAGVNNTTYINDLVTQRDFDFTSETAGWDYLSAPSPSIPYSDSTWVIRNYSLLKYRDQKINEFARSAITGKPFIAEMYYHIYPNAHRAEMMLFLPAYSMLHDWSGFYYYLYNDRNTEMVDRRRQITGDYYGMISDPASMALMPQVSAMVRNGWISPAERTLRLWYDSADIRSMPLYGGRNVWSLDGTLNSVVGLVQSIRVDSFNASRHYKADEYYVTIPTDDAIESDTRQIKLDITKGVMQVNTPMFQAASGQIANVSSVRTDNLAVNWISGGEHVTYMLTPLDTLALDSSRRALLTITTRATNTNPVWQFGDSSIGKQWGAAPTQMEGVSIAAQFYTAADSVIVYPLDSLGLPTGRTIATTRGTGGSWRSVFNLTTEKTPWFGIEMVFRPEDTSTTSAGAVNADVAVGQPRPNPAAAETSIEVVLPQGGEVLSAEVHDMIGRPVRTIEPHRAVAGRSTLFVDVRNLPSGNYVCIVHVNGRSIVRRLVVTR